MQRERVIIQGYPGSYHDVACEAYFGEGRYDLVAADSFSQLGKAFGEDLTLTQGMMAIENSIAGTLLQNYRILRESNFSVISEVYLRIEHCLMCLPGQSLSDIKEVHSHPMAINQCRTYFKDYPHLKLIDADDTALSAKYILENQLKGVAAIASERAHRLYNLQLLDQGIEDSKYNYTRFFVIDRERHYSKEANKASVWVRVGHEKGSLLKVLDHIYQHKINLSKLQSFPVLGKFSEYFFHMDLEFDKLDQYLECKGHLQSDTLEYQELGLYKRADISAALRREPINVML